MIITAVSINLVTSMDRSVERPGTRSYTLKISRKPVSNTWIVSLPALLPSYKYSHMCLWLCFMLYTYVYDCVFLF